MIPFEPLRMPLDKTLIDINFFFNEYGLAVKSLATLDAKLKGNEVSTMYSFNHLVKTESFYSTKIEGTRTTIDEVYESSLDISDTRRSADIREVLRYDEALRMGIKCITEEKLITNKMIMHLHRVLLSGDIRKNSGFQAGEFRHQQNKVGNHMPPKAIDVPELMGNLEKYMNDSSYDIMNLPPLIKIALIHAQFETIHPFPDGNGRVGRVLIPLYLFKEQEIDIPCFFISQELERNKQRYYNYLQGTRNETVEGFTKWIKFFLISISKQCQRDIIFIEQLTQLRYEVNKKLRNEINTNNIDNIVQRIFEEPIFTCKSLCEKTGIKETTMRMYLQKMVDLEIVFSSQQKRHKRYYFSDLLDIIRN